MGTGTGSFGPATSYPSIAVGAELGIADFNGDGKLDICGTSLINWVALGDGFGNFGFSADIPSIGSAGAVGDFNNDGKPDLVGFSNSVVVSSVTVILNTTATSPLRFARASYSSVGTRPESLAVADLNADGKPDLIVANDGTFNISVLLGGGAGNFGSATAFPAGSNFFLDGPYSMKLGDFNADGKMDLVVVTDNFSGYVVLLGNGVGGFGAPTTVFFAFAPTFLTTGDFNADGKLDLAIGNLNGSVSIFLGVGNGTFGTGTNFPAGSSAGSAVTGDFNSDGKLDLVLTDSTSRSIVLLTGTGSGGFNAPTSFSVGTGLNSRPVSVAVSDFNSDGKTDLVVGLDSGTIDILLGLGNGTFAAPTNYPFLATANSALNIGQPSFVSVGDFNSDGKQDIVVTHSRRNTVAILLNNGAGMFGTAISFAIGAGASAAAVGDFDLDGLLDLAITPAADTTTGTFLDRVAVMLNRFGTVAADFDGDGKADVGIYRDGLWAIIRSSGGGLIVENLGGASHIAVPADYDGDDKNDIAVYLPATGQWSIKRSSDGVTTNTGFGGPSFSPVPADYDGDSKTDISVHMSGAWWIKRSSNNAITVVGHGGGPADVPLN